MGLDINRMKQERGKRSQADIAESAGMSMQAYQRIESGKHTNVSIETLEAIAKALGVKAKDLLK